MDDGVRRGIEWDATQHVLRFYRSLDERTGEPAGEYFDDHGTWERMGTEHDGLAAIEKTIGAVLACEDR